MLQAVGEVIEAAVRIAVVTAIDGGPDGHAVVVGAGLIGHGMLLGRDPHVSTGAAARWVLDVEVVRAPGVVRRFAVS